ncbi:MAG: hypothetical protein ACQUHE_02520 [Bacteroidia bacterium]
MAFTKEEREKNKSVLLATLNYLLEYHSNDMVFDDYSPSRLWYLEELRKTEFDIQKYRSNQIKRRLDMHIALLRSKFDQGLNNYVKEHTGYEIDIFEAYKARVMPMVSRGYIGDNDVYLIEDYLSAYEANPAEQERVAVLKDLLAKREARINELTSISEETFYWISGTAGTLSEAEHLKWMSKWLLYEQIAPNGVFKLSVQISGRGEDALTYVNITLGGGTGPIYGARGEKLPIKAYWKDDHHVVIETSSQYAHQWMYKQVSSYGELVKIAYAIDFEGSI